RGEAVTVLSYIAPEGFDEPLRTVVGDATAPPRARTAAARGLGRLGSADAATLIVPLLDDPNFQLMGSAVTALLELTRRISGWSQDRSSLLIDSLRRAFDRAAERPEIRADAVMAIGQVRDIAPVDFLRDVAERDRSIDVRVAAVTGLGRIERPEVASI